MQIVQRQNFRTDEPHLELCKHVSSHAKMTDEGQGSNRVESASVHTVPIGNSNISSGPSRSSISERSATEPVLRQPPITSLTKDDENSKNGDAIQSASAEKGHDYSKARLSLIYILIEQNQTAATFQCCNGLRCHPSKLPAASRGLEGACLLLITWN